MNDVAKTPKNKETLEVVAERFDTEAKEATETHDIEPSVPQRTITPHNQDNTVEGFISAAIQQQLPVETIERFLAMRKELKADQAKEAFTMAMAQFQKDCPVIARTKEVKNKEGKVTYRYAPLDSIILQVKKTLGENNLAYDFSETRTEKEITVTCTITHSLGHTKSSSFTVEIGSEAYMTDTQKYGARNTFAKRYAFMNVLGIATGDEDTDARELTQKPPRLNPATNRKAMIVSLLKKLGMKDTTSAELVREKILELTQLEPVEANFEEIISRLTVLLEEQNAG